MKPLYLTISEPWFSRIESGYKKEEYREIKPYYDSRFKKEYNTVLFVNGYTKKSPRMLIELKEITKGFGKKEWGAPEHKVYILKLGNIIASSNIDDEFDILFLP